MAEELKRTERHEDSGEIKAAAFSGEKKRMSTKFQGKCHNCEQRGQKSGEANSADFIASRKIENILGNSQDEATHCDSSSEGRRNTGIKNGWNHRWNVLYVPELRDNLMSVKKLVKAGVVVIFCGSVAVLKKNNEVIATANLRGNLYEIEVDIPVSSANMCQTEATNLWHRRLGHLSQQGMKAIISNNLVDGADFRADKLAFCDACVQGKQCREPFNGNADRKSVV